MEKKCPNDGTKLIFEDESFSHEFGTKEIKYYWCPNCDYSEDFE